MTLQALHQEAILKSIFFYYVKLQDRLAFCLQKDKLSFIAIDKSVLHSEREEKRVIAEEIAHCEYNLTYHLQDYNNPLQRQNARRAESLARRCASKKIVPLDELKEALSSYENIYDVCEELDADLPTVQTAINSYEMENAL